MENHYNPVNTNTPRKVYLDLNHKLHTPYEVNPDSQGTDIIYCKVAGRMAWRMARPEFVEDYLAYCSQCIELFDPGYDCPKITVAGRRRVSRLLH